MCLLLLFVGSECKKGWEAMDGLKFLGLPRQGRVRVLSLNVRIGIVKGY